MRRAFVSAIRTMCVIAPVRFAVVLRGAAVRIRIAYRHDVFVDVVAVQVMHMSIMEVVDVPVMTDLHVAASIAVHMAVPGVRSTLGVLHTSSFLAGNPDNCDPKDNRLLIG